MRSSVIGRDLVVALLLALAFLILCAATIVGCKPPVAGTWTGGVISCATESVQRNWARAYPEVQTCLTAAAVDPMQCLDAVPGLVQVGIDVVACIVRGTGKEAAAQFHANPGDDVSGRKAQRADNWLVAKGFQFQ